MNMNESFIAEAAAASSSSAIAVLLLFTMIVFLVAILPGAGGGSYHHVVYDGGIPSTVASDARLKINIVPTGAETAHGIPLYRFSYKGYPQHRFEGVLAQDVARKMPGAVVQGKSGYLAVDYKKLGLDIKIVR